MWVSLRAVALIRGHLGVCVPGHGGPWGLCLWLEVT